MAIGGRAIPDTIQLQHWLSLVPDTRGAQRLLVRDITDLAGRMGGEADRLLADLAEEDTEVREAVKRIMEGGEAAFNLRREKYGF